MIQPPSLLEALQRAGLGLGDAATGMQQVDQGNQQIAASKTNQAVQNQTLLGEMKKRQLLDAMAALDKNQPTAASSLPMGAGKAGLGMDASGMPTGLQGPGAAKAGVGAPPGGMDDARASLMANWYRENGKPELGTPDAVKAFSAQKMTEMKNAATLSSQDVARGQIANDTGAFDLGQKKTLAPFQQTTEQNKAAASAFEPAQAKATLGQTQAETNRANAEANKANNEATFGSKAAITLERQANSERDAYYKDLHVGDIEENWKNIQDAYRKATDPKNTAIGASDYQIADQFLKMINPGVSVRSSNLQMLKDSMGLSDELSQKIVGLQKGGKLGPQLRTAILKQAADIHQNKMEQYNGKVADIIDRIRSTPGTDLNRTFGKDFMDRWTADHEGNGGATGATLDQADQDLINKYKPKTNAG